MKENFNHKRGFRPFGGPFGPSGFNIFAEGCKEENMFLYHKFNALSEMFERRSKMCSSKISNMSRGQGRILAILKRRDGFSTKELAELLNISVTSLNESLNKLEQNGFIEKVPSEDDKRIRVIKLTEKGREFKFRQFPDLDIFDCLSDDEKEVFDEYLTRISFEFHKKMKMENPEKFEMMRRHREMIFRKYFEENDFEEWFDKF